MKLYIEKLTPEQWEPYSKSAHKISFSVEREAEMDRIDFAFIARNDELPCAYSTQIELDKDSVYMQHGGAFPNVENGVYAVKSYLLFINKLKSDYKHISTRVHNSNVRMLKLAMAAGLRITGVDFEGGEIILNLMWRKEWDQKN